jgi:hypothetical protein
MRLFARVRASEARTIHAALVLASVFAWPLACRKNAPLPPKLVVQGTTRLDSVEHGQPLRFALAVRNDGGETARALRVETDGDCVAKFARDVVPPGESTALEIVCESQTYGPYQRRVTLLSNARESPKLELTATIEPTLAFERPTLELKTTFGASASGEMPIVGTRSRENRLALGALAGEGVSAELLPASSARPPKVRLTLDGKRVGTRVGQVAVKSDFAGRPEITLLFRATVDGTLRVEPENPYLNLRFEAGRKLSLTVTSSQPGFSISEVKVLEGPFTATLVPTPVIGGARTIEVRVALDEVSRETRGANGRLLIRSNDRSEPAREVPLFALGKPGAADHPE